MPQRVIFTLRHVLTAVLLQAFAVLLALYQNIGSVRTDEAKYLLNIPYPHPPLARAVIHSLEWMPYQELFWRVVFASLLVQSVWLVVRLAKNLSSDYRLALAGFWIFSASVLFQSGTIMMAPLTALQGLVFVWLLTELATQRRDGCRLSVVGCYADWIPLFWLGSLFTAYQAILYLPIVVAIVWRMNMRPFMKGLVVFVPVLLLSLYILGNPLAISSFLSAGGQNAALSPALLFTQVLTAWLFSGSVVLSVVGVMGMWRSRSIPLLISTAMVVLFLAVSYRSYYAILFLPLLVGGVAASPVILRKSATLLAMQIVAATAMFAHAHLEFSESSARKVMRVLNAQPGEGIVLVSGTFGHEWQYESTSPMYRYRSALLSRAKAVVCLEACPEVSGYGFSPIEKISQDVWVRRD